MTTATGLLGPIVIDVGCARYGGDFSIERLIENFSPSVVYGFDPSWEDGMYVPPEDEDSPLVIISDSAVWKYDGEVRFRREGLNGHISSLSNADATHCIDIAEFIRARPEEADIILKIDAEGAEYEILEHLIATGADERLTLAWVEWHRFGVPDPPRHRASIEERIKCEITEWLW